MAGIRQPRTERRAGGSKLLIGERDLFILEALGKLRFATTRQLTTLAFGSTSGTNKRLRKLLDAGLVRVWVRSLAQENTYALTTAGRNALRGDDVGECAFQTPRRLDGNIDHLLGINSVRVSLASQLAADGAEIRSWRSDWELRGHAIARLISDAVFEISWEDGGRLVACLELDHHTKGPRRFLKKILGYASIRPGGEFFGVTGFAIMVVGHNARWMRRYRAATAHVIGHIPIWFTTLAQVQENAIGPIWESLGGEMQSLRDLRALPYCTEGSAPKIPRPADAFGETAARLSPDIDEAKRAGARFVETPCRRSFPSPNWEPRC